MDFSRCNESVGVLCWVSPRESDAEYTSGLFDSTISLFGSGKSGNVSYNTSAWRQEDHNDITAEQIRFNSAAEMDAVREDPGVRFMAYNPYYLYEACDEVVKRAVCLNDRNLLAMLEDKLSFRRFARQHVDVPPMELVRCDDCSLHALNRRFGMVDGSYVVQKRVSSGGAGTAVLGRGVSALPDGFRSDDSLLVSPYYEANVPVNVHAVIFNDGELVFPPSVQLVVPSSGKLVYRGCDYPAYRSLPSAVDGILVDGMRRLCEALRGMGYRGVIGFDAIVTDGGVLFLECNPRFQASSHALNRSLMEEGLPSLQELNLTAFGGEEPPAGMEGFVRLRQLYSSLSYTAGEADYATCLLPVFEDRGDTKVSLDGYAGQPCAEGAYLYSVMFSRNVSWPNADGTLNIQQGLVGRTDEPDLGLLDSSRTVLKTALLNQGARISEEGVRRLLADPHFVGGVNRAIDIEVDGFVVNVPVGTGFSWASPFELRVLGGGELQLLCLGKTVSTCRLATHAPDRSSLPAAAAMASLLTTDRLRLSHSAFCVLKGSGLGCAFCDIESGEPASNVENAMEAFDWYFEHGRFRHVLIGGGTGARGEETGRICAVARHVRERSDMPIYVMCLPWHSIDEMRAMREAGVTEVGFNMEVASGDVARGLMGWKGGIGRGEYERALLEAREIWPEPGAVRSALVVGLGRTADTLERIGWMARNGISPILSVFRPMPGTLLQDVIPPSDEWLLRLLRRAEEICHGYGVELGPDCALCQNNTLNEVRDV